jgi:transposase
MTVAADMDVASLELPQDLATCQAMIIQLLEQVRSGHQQVEKLEHQLAYLLRRVYGRSSEKIDPNQQVLFADLAAPEQPAPPPQPAPAPQPAPTTRRHKHGRRRIPDDLPRKRVEVDLPEEEKCCPACGEMRQRIGQETCEQLDYVPARLQVLVTVRHKYACSCCEQAGHNPQIQTPPPPPAPIDRCLATPALLAHVGVSKFQDHLPLHRLERVLGRCGVDLGRSTLDGWLVRLVPMLLTLVNLMCQRVRQSKVIHTDDTPVDVLGTKRKQQKQVPAHKGRFWVYVGDRDHPYIVFDFTPSRRRDGPVSFLEGWGADREVFLQADAYGGYDGICLDPESHVRKAGCWAHARRKFYDARNSDVARAHDAMARIRLLYDLEGEAQEQFQKEQQSGGGRSLSQIRLALRQARAVPVLEQFKEWLQKQQASQGGPVLPRSPMGQAIGYVLNQWESLCVYCTDGDVEIDNNAAERALRRVAIGRNNWMFCASDQGGKTASVFYSLIATCERHGVNAYEYLRDVLERIATTPLSMLGALLPDRWQAARAAQDTAAAQSAIPGPAGADGVPPTQPPDGAAPPAPPAPPNPAG